MRWRYRYGSARPYMRGRDQWDFVSVGYLFGPFTSPLTLGLLHFSFWRIAFVAQHDADAGCGNFAAVIGEIESVPTQIVVPQHMAAMAKRHDVFQNAGFEWSPILEMMALKMPL